MKSKENKFIVGSRLTNLVEACLQGSSEANKTDDLTAAFLTAAMINDLPALDIMLDQGVDIDFQDQTGSTALMEATFGGHIDAVRLLIDRGADVNLTNCDGWTPLMEACSKGYAEIARILISSGANVKSEDKSGWTALKLVPKRQVKLARLLNQFYCAVN